MATTNRILLKKSSVVGKIPGAFDIEYGELALNFSDGRLYFKNSDNDIDFFQSGTSSPLLPFAANEGDFGSVTSNKNDFEFKLGSLTDSNVFTHGLGDLSIDPIDALQESEDAISLFLKDNNLGEINDPSIEKSFTLTALNDFPSESFDLGLVNLNGAFRPDRFIMPSFTVGTLPTGTPGELALVTDETNGPVPAFFDGSEWRRMSDNQIVSTV